MVGGGGESACTPDSVPGLRPGDGHPSRPAVARRLLRPTRGSGGRAAHPLCSALLRVGFVEPPRSPPALVRSYRTVSPLPRTFRPEAVCFLLHFPWDCSRWALPSTLPFGARTFLRPRSSAARGRLWYSDVRFRLPVTGRSLAWIRGSLAIARCRARAERYAVWARGEATRRGVGPRRSSPR